MTRVGSMFTIFFRCDRPTNFSEVSDCDMGAFGRFHRAALNEGVYFPPSQYEACFLPSGMSESERDHLVEGIRRALRES